MKIAALLTAKKESSLKNKNILKLLNKSLIEYPCIEAKKCNYIDRFFLSTDSNKILNFISRKYNFEKIKRPKKLASKTALHRDVLLHAMDFLKKKNYFPDIFLVLLGNAPMIKTKWIKDCIKLIKKNPKASAVVPVYNDNDHNPLRCMKIDGKYLNNFIKISKKKISSNRQDLPKSYFLCHNFWVVRKEAIIKDNGIQPWSFLGQNIIPYSVHKTLDVHNKIDLEVLNILMKRF